MSTKIEVSRPADFTEFCKESALQGIHERIEDQVRLHAANTALKTRDIAYTYAETNGFANSIAAEILAVSGKALAQAAILQPNAPDTIIAILSSLKAHKAYVPLDPNFPKERLRFMLEDAEPAVLLTDDEHMDLAQELAGKRVHIINTSQIKRHADAPNPRVPCDPLDRAYILYTSGSTGRPKGIAFLHRNLLHSTMCLTNRLHFAPSDRVTWLHSISFAASVVDIYCCLTNGGTLYPWDAKTQGFTGLSDWLVQQRLTTFQWIPSAFRQFLRTIPGDFVFRDIRIVVMASEPLSVREVELFRRHFPLGSHLVNQVGTSESYNYRLYAVDHQIPIASATVPGGYAVSDDRDVLILDDGHHRLPVGSVGEIGVRSEFMSAGYWRDDALTKSKFVRIGADDVPVYLTGDLGSLEPDGCLIHLGRKDSQVKIRGCRVELAEIDHALSAAPGVADAASWVVKNRLGEIELVGYVTLLAPGQFNQDVVEKHLAATLPEYMVPRRYVILDCFPTLPTGKVDRNGLPNPFDRAAPPMKPAESSLASVGRELIDLYGELLQLNGIHADSDFLKAGGDSLLTAVLLSRVHRRFNVEISIDDFLESPTPRHLARQVTAARVNGTTRSSLIDEPDIPEGYPIPRPPKAEPSHASRGRKNLVIIGAGQLGREVFTWAEQAIAAGASWKIKGFLDRRADALDGYYYQAKVLGDVSGYEIAEDDAFIGAIGNPRLKIQCYSPIVERGGLFINLIHPLANVGKNVQLGAGIVLGPFASVTCDVKIGNHVAIGALSNAGHDTVIGDWCQISSHCGINGTATLGEGVFVGSHACIIPGIRVGAWAFVGAGSVVVKHVQSRVKVFGNPAVPIGRVEHFSRSLLQEHSAHPASE